jgi:Type II CAAX prenyl endopeptidase Rce1-like
VVVVSAAAARHAGHNAGFDAIRASKRPECERSRNRVSDRLPASAAFPVRHHQLVGGDGLDGFVQAPLQQRFGPWRAVLLTAPFFSLAHVSAMFDGTFTQVLVKFLLLAVLVIPIRALLAWLYNRTGGIALVGLVHAASNASAFGLVPALYHQTGDGGLPFLLIAIAAIAFSRGRLGARHRTASPQEA